MRKLSTLILLALLASPAFCLPASSGPSKAPTAPSTDVIWIAVGNQPVAIAVAERMVTICYYGVTMSVREKIAERYLRIGATCGPCNERRGGQDGPSILIPSVARGEVCGEGDVEVIFLLTPKSATDKAVKIGGAAK